MMKWMFVGVSVLCGISLSILSGIIATGRIPFRPDVGVLPEVHINEAPKLVKEVSLSSVGGAAMAELEKSLKAQQEVYAQKLAKLSDKEKEIQQRQDTFDFLKGQITDMQAKLDQKVVEVEQAEQANLKRLATLYSKMDPENAVSLLMDMDSTERAAKVLMLISERQAGAILNAAVTSKGAKGVSGTKIAGEWSDAIRRMKGKAK